MAGNGWPVRARLALLLVVAVLLGTAGAGAAYFRSTVVDGQTFAERAVDALGDPDVRSIVAREVADELTDAVPRAAQVRPLVELVVEGVVATPAFRGIFVAAVQDLHQTLLLGQDDTATLRLVDAVLVIKTQLAVVAPDLAAVIPADLTDALVELSTEDFAVDPGGTFAAARVLGTALPLAALALLGIYVMGARNHREALVPVGFAVGACGVGLVAVEQAGRAVVLASTDTGSARTVAASLWDALAADVGDWSLALIAAGALLAATSFLTAQGVNFAALTARTAAALRPPRRHTARLVWSVALGLGGLALMARGEQVLRAVITAAGAVLVVVAVGEISRLVAPVRARARGPRGSGPAPLGWRAPRPALVVGAVSIPVLALGAAVTMVMLPADSERVPTSFDPRCNGSVLLCDRPFDQVVFAATHNSMASTREGFAYANHDGDVLEQLQAGYRGLLIDAYHGLSSPRSPVVVTDRAPTDEATRRRLVAEIGPDAVARAEAIRARALGAGGTRSTYLCHAFCELGAVDMVTELTRVRDWLRANPREVIVIFVQDEIAPADIVAAFEAAELAELAHTQRPAAPWPTLGEMITSGERVMVMAEHDATGPSWYHDGFAFTQDTPFRFDSVADFSCAPNRGNPDSPLLMINHFVSPPSRPAAVQANDAEVLRDRLMDCQLRRGRIPNIVAVDFFDRGDVLGVVDDLNGVTRPARRP